MKKRIFSLLLALALCGGLAVPAFAAGETVYHLHCSELVTEKESQVSISGEGLKLIEEIYYPDALAAGQGWHIFGDSYPVFSSSKPVTVTVTADYNGWRDTKWIPEVGWDWGDCITEARVLRLSYDAASGKYDVGNWDTWEDVAYFDGTYALSQFCDGDGPVNIVENAGTLEDLYKRGGYLEDGARIYQGATVTLSEPGDYRIYVTAGDRWTSIINYADIHITADSSTPAFTDVPPWCADAVNWAVDRDITNGTGGGKFSPNTNCTHVQILTFLWRAEDRPTSTATKFTGLAGDYAPAANWAYETGLIDNSFNPSAPCTRADAVIYIWKTFGEMGADGAGFIDVPAEAETLSAAVNFAAACGITNGYANVDGTYSFRPSKTCSRGEIATFLYRAYEPGAQLTTE